MTCGVPEWQFSAEVDAGRAARLLSYPDFDTVASLLIDAAVECFSWERFDGEKLRGCSRASFLLRVSSEAYDAFFNSPAGYRGQFAASKAAGEEANSMLLRLFEARLIAYAEGRSSVPRLSLSDSLRAAQAKVWIYERDVQSQLGASAPEIIFAPWQQQSEDGVGLLAPLGTRLEVKGGWLSADGVARPNPLKLGRSEEIHRTGFS